MNAPPSPQTSSPLEIPPPLSDPYRPPPSTRGRPILFNRLIQTDTDYHHTDTDTNTNFLLIQIPIFQSVPILFQYRYRFFNQYRYSQNTDITDYTDSN